ncbi:NADH-quinone oxidoreductase subunit NuoK [Buchnera aphidicola (Neophyllaphis podocarpi)]|uniref:NADH-quinone oxidoreductase subunit NuoK n=1 Tax=Buchnera aphidicola TaxID=9 RepID=UPI0031B81D15
MIFLSHGLILSAILFILGLSSLIIRRNLLFIFISIEVMMNSSALALVISGNYWNNDDGSIMYILAITIAAAEASISLAFLIQFYRRYKHLNIDILSEIYK